MAGSQADEPRIWLMDLPHELRGPGAIQRRQTTFWDLRSVLGACFRVHFRGKVEFAFHTEEYAGVEVVRRHALLMDYQEAWLEVYIASAAPDAVRLSNALDTEIRALSQGWRALASYANQDVACTTLLSRGHGLLLRAPAPIGRAAWATLQFGGVRAHTLPGWAARAGKCVLLMDASFVIASEFSFERLEE